MKPGRLFLFGIYGTTPRRETVALLKQSGAAGVLLLGRNIETAAQTKALISGLEQKLGRRLLVSIDHEGGWVLRFKAGVTATPGNAALGRLKDERLAYQTGAQMGRELSALGVQLNLAPVLDVLSGRYNPGIGIRSFGADPALAGRLGAAMIRGLQRNGVHACAKHFPGKGAATVDAHVKLPTIRLSEKELRDRHLKPFADAIEAGVSSIMSSHVLFPTLDKRPATFSPRITRGLLRETLGFAGCVISDDLCMGAVTETRSVQEASVDAVEAGHDLLIIAHDVGAMWEAPELLELAVSDGRISQNAIDEAGRRAESLIAPPSRAGRPSAAKGRALSARVARGAVESVQSGALALPLRPGDAQTLVLLPDFDEVKERFTFEGGARGPETALKRKLRSWRGARLMRAPVEKTATGQIEEAARRAGRVVFFCFEAMRFPGQKATLELLKKTAASKTVVCLIRNPIDREWLSPSMSAIDLYGYRQSQLDAGFDMIFGRKR